MYKYVCMHVYAKSLQYYMEIIHTLSSAKFQYASAEFQYLSAEFQYAPLELQYTSFVSLVATGFQRLSEVLWLLSA